MTYKMKGFSGFGNSPLKQETIRRGRKKHARSSREYAHYVEGQKKGTKSTHLMVDDVKGNPTGTYSVWPSITTDKEGYEKQTQEEAHTRGEVYEFKSKRRAEKFAAGSWKKGKDRREAMRAYRKKKRAIKRNFSNVRPLYFDMD